MGGTEPGAAAPRPPWPGGAAWIDGRYCPIEEAKISVLDLGVTRSDCTYDVVHVWRGRFYRLDGHLDRFAASMALLRLMTTTPTSSCSATCPVRSPKDPGTTYSPTWTGAGGRQAAGTWLTRHSHQAHRLPVAHHREVGAPQPRQQVMQEPGDRGRRRHGDRVGGHDLPLGCCTNRNCTTACWFSAVAVPVKNQSRMMNHSQL